MFRRNHARASVGTEKILGFNEFLLRLDDLAQMLIDRLRRIRLGQKIRRAGIAGNDDIGVFRHRRRDDDRDEDVPAFRIMAQPPQKLQPVITGAPVYDDDIRARVLKSAPCLVDRPRIYDLSDLQGAQNAFDCQPQK